MCMCSHRYGKPNINGQPGYCWTSMDEPEGQVRRVDPPALASGDTLIYDEPGRCGGLDSHSHHFRLVKDSIGRIALLVRHGCGDQRFNLHDFPGVKPLLEALASMDTHGRYWTFQLLDSMCYDVAKAARDEERARWAKAAVEKRIKLRRRRGTVRVEIETPIVMASVA